MIFSIRDLSFEFGSVLLEGWFALAARAGCALLILLAAWLVRRWLSKRGIPALLARKWYFNGTPILLRSFAVPIQRMCTAVGVYLAAASLPWAIPGIARLLLVCFRLVMTLLVCEGLYAASDLAALLLADWARGRDLDGVAARAEEIYRRMKREHPFLTGAEDSVFAVLLALSPDTEQAVVDQVEACYDALKHPFGTGQYTQALSHVLALGEGSSQEKRDKVLGVYQGLKAAGWKYGAGYELGTLGSLALLPAPVEELTADVLEVDEFLSHQKGYRGILGLPKNQRLMHSAMLVSGDYVDQRKTSVMGAAAVSGTVAMIAAQEMALCAVMVGGIGASAAANNDG